MSKTGKTKPRKKNRRNQTKYPALDKGLNVSSRYDYIEPEYINGVKNANGELVIPPLNEEAKRFLNQYYEEAVITNFIHHPEIRRLHDKKNKIIVDDTVRILQKELRELKVDKITNKKRISEIKQIIRITKKSNEELYEDQLKDIEIELQELRDEYLLFNNQEERSELYGENNSRNRCIFNISKIQCKLDFLDPYQYEKMEELSSDNIDAESELINKLERENYEKEEERLKSVSEKLKNYKYTND